VNVSSTPSGASIVLNGNLKGVTPLALSMNPKHSHHIVLEKEGYQPKYYTIKSNINAMKLGSNALIPLGTGLAAAVAAIAVCIYSFSGTLPIISGLIIIPCATYGLVAGAAIGIIGTGVDLYSGKAKQLSTTKIHAELEPAKILFNADQ